MVSRYNHLLAEGLSLEPHQEEGVRYARLHHYHLNCDAPGVGKTLQALTTLFHFQAKTEFPCLCVVPSYLSLNWEGEIHKFSKHKKKVKVLDSGKKINSFMGKSKADFIITSYSLFRKYPQLLRYVRAVIFDEVHYLKNVEAKVTQESHAALEQWAPDLMIGLTGTPVKNRVPEFYSLMCLCHYNKRDTSGVKVLDLFTFPDFQSRFCFREKVKIKGRYINKYYGLKNKPELKSLLRGKYIRRTNEVLGLDEPIFKDIYVSYSENKELLQAWEEFNKGIKSSVNSTIKRDAALINAPATAELLRDLIQSDQGPVVVFTCHPDAAEQIKEFSGVSNISIITGGTSNGQRATYVEEFQNGNLQALICTIGAASTGLNLYRSNVMVFNDEDWVPENNSQAMHRILRKGQTRRCHFYFMRGSKAEKLIGQKLKEKTKTIKQVMED